MRLVGVRRDPQESREDPPPKSRTASLALLQGALHTRSAAALHRQAGMPCSARERGAFGDAGQRRVEGFGRGGPDRALLLRLLHDLRALHALLAGVPRIARRAAGGDRPHFRRRLADPAVHAAALGLHRRPLSRPQAHASRAQPHDGRRARPVRARARLCPAPRPHGRRDGGVAADDAARRRRLARPPGGGAPHLWARADVGIDRLHPHQSRRRLGARTLRRRRHLGGDADRGLRRRRRGDRLARAHAAPRRGRPADDPRARARAHRPRASAWFSSPGHSSIQRIRSITASRPSIGAASAFRGARSAFCGRSASSRKCCSSPSPGAG